MRSRLLALLLTVAGPLALPAQVAAKPAVTAAKAPARPAQAAQKEAARGSQPPSKPKLAAKAAKKREPPPCYAPPVRLTRQREGRVEVRSLSLTYCDGRPVLPTLDELSVLARPREADAEPSSAEREAYGRRPLDKGPREERRKPGHLAESVMRLHPDLLLRLQAIADHFPGKAIDIVSGYRPRARATSRHHHGRALDLRVDGVSRERLRDFARTLENTGVGYYPNSVFVHVDVRDDKGYWVDRSGPGEPPDYGPWPPRATDRASDVDGARERLLRDAYGALAELADFDLWDDDEPGEDARATVGAHRSGAALAVRARGAPARSGAPSSPPDHVDVPMPRPVLTALPLTEGTAGEPVERPLTPAPAERRMPSVLTLPARPEPAAPEPAAPKTRPAAAPAARGKGPARLVVREEPERVLNAHEVARIRADALKALAALR